MKLKFPILAALFFILSHTQSQAQLITVARQANFPLSKTVTLTQSGPLTIIWSGAIDYWPSNNPVATLKIDGTAVDTYPLPKDWLTNYQSRPFRTQNLAPGSHTIQISVELAINQQDPTLLIIAEAEPTAGVQAALDQLTADFQSGDAAVQAALTAQINAIQAALASRITTLESQVTTLQTGSSTQATQIAALTGQLTELQNQKTVLETRITSLDSQIATLQTSSGNQTTQISALTTQLADFQNQKAALEANIASLNSQIPTLQGSNTSQSAQISELTSQLTGLQNQQAALLQQIAELEQRPTSGGTIVQSKKTGLSTTDYLIMGGSAAGATALGVGIYSILNSDSGDASEGMPAKNVNRPGYRE